MILNLAHLQRQFDRRAARYAEHDAVLREVAARMHERLDLIKASPARVLDAGCGIGRDLPSLRTRYPSAHVFALDLSEQSLRQWHRPRHGLMAWWKQLTRSVLSHTHAVQANFAALPFANASLDMIYSNLSLPHNTEPHQLFPEWARTLKPGGLLMFSTLGPDTLHECRKAGLGKSIPDWVDMHDLGDMMIDAGFTTPVVDMEKLTVTYPNAEALLTELHAWGGNASLERRTGLAGKHHWRSIRDALTKQQNPQGRISLTLEVIYGHAWRGTPRPEMLIDQEGSTWVGVKFTPQKTIKQK